LLPLLVKLKAGRSCNNVQSCIQGGLKTSCCMWYKYHLMEVWDIR